VNYAPFGERDGSQRRDLESFLAPAVDKISASQPYHLEKKKKVKRMFMSIDAFITIHLIHSKVRGVVQQSTG